MLDVDSQTAGELIELLLGLRAERGMTLGLATHDPVIASSCDRVVRLLDGHVLDDLPIDGGADGEAMLERSSRIGP